MIRIVTVSLLGLVFGSHLIAEDSSVARLRLLPPGAISAGTPFVLAAGGESYLFNPSQRVMKAPFLKDVYKAFGFSPDRSEFLYLKSKGRLPGFSLYVYRFSDSSDRLISSEVVEKAIWSPNGSQIAYVTMDSLTRHQLFLTGADGGTRELLSAGRIDSELLEFSGDGRRLLFRSLSELPGNSLETPRHLSVIHEIELSSREDRQVDGANWAGYDGNRLQLSMDGRKESGRLFTGTRIAPWRDGEITRFRLTKSGTFTGRIANGVQIVEKYVQAGDRFESIAFGTMEQVLPEGLVIRNFVPTGVEYKFYNLASGATQELFAFYGFYRLPFIGSGQNVQGNSGGSCDGGGCPPSSHFGLLAFATDWRVGLGGGVLAVEEGTVAAVASDITCNSGATGCPTYSADCQGNDGAGNYVYVAHPDGSYTLYAHLAVGSVSVSVAGQVCQGAQLGRQGNTGSTGGGSNCGDHIHIQRTSGVGAPWGASIAMDFIETPCAIACNSFYTSTNGSAGCNGLVAYDFGTFPFGLNLNVDGATSAAPRSFAWPANSQHTVEAISPQPSAAQGSRFGFTSWSDSGPQSRTVNVGSTFPSLTANYVLQWRVVTSVSNPEFGSVVVEPASPDGYYADGSTIQITAVPVAGYRLKSWSGSSNLSLPTIGSVVNQSQSFVATFEPKPITDYTISTNPPGLNILVDGTVMTAPQLFQWKENETHTVSAPSPQTPGSIQYVFTGWSDGGTQTRTIKVGQPPATLTANFGQRHRVTIQVVPPGSGTVTTNPVSPDGYYTAGSSIQLIPVPAAGKRIASWSGDLVSTLQSPTVVVSKPLVITAIFEDGPTIGTGGVVNGADYSARLAPGAIMSIYGTNLATAAQAATQLPLPASILGTSVDVVDGNRTLPAYVFSVSPFQVNVLMPFEVLGTTVDVVAKTAHGTFTVKSLAILPQAPALFTFDSSGVGQAIVVHSNYTLATPSAPVRGGESVFLYAAGLGATNPAKQKGEPGGDGGVLGPLNKVDDPVTVTIGDQAVTAFFAGIAPGFAGVYQVNFTLPTGLTAGNQPIKVTINGRSSGLNVVVPYAP